MLLGSRMYVRGDNDVECSVRRRRDTDRGPANHGGSDVQVAPRGIQRASIATRRLMRAGRATASGGSSDGQKWGSVETRKERLSLPEGSCIQLNAPSTPYSVEGGMDDRQASSMPWTGRHMFVHANMVIKKVVQTSPNTKVSGSGSVAPSAIMCWEG